MRERGGAMIDYDKPDDDPVVAEVRRIREEIFAEYNHDLRAMFEDMRRREATSGRMYANLAPRPLVPDAPGAKKVG
jgi:hypothetical protein